MGSERKFIQVSGVASLAKLHLDDFPIGGIGVSRHAEGLSIESMRAKPLLLRSLLCGLSSLSVARCHDRLIPSSRDADKPRCCLAQGRERLPISVAFCG